MLLDKNLQFASAVSVATAADRILVGDVVDLQGLGSGTGGARDIGNGRPVYLVIQVTTEVITGGTAGTIAFELVSDAQEAIVPDTATVHFRSTEFVTDDAAANAAQLAVGGVPVCIAIPMEGVVYERYLGIVADIETTEVTAGAISAFLTLDASKYKHYAQGQVA